MQNATIYGQYNATLPSVGDGQSCRVQLDSSGRILIGSIAPGTAATSLGKAEDAVHASGDVGIFALGVRTDTPASLAGTTGDYTGSIYDSLNHLWTRDGFAPVAEDNDIGVIKVEKRYSGTKVTADGQIKASGGFVHAVTLSPTGVVTAGTITLYDNTAESGTQKLQLYIPTTLQPVTLICDFTCATGIYVGYDGTIANVSVTVSWR